jgi:nitrate reductase NapE component
MYIKYKNIKSLLDEKVNKRNESLEEIVFKTITYIFLVIIFFHHYILEYYFFGIYGFIYYLIGIFGKNGQFSEIYTETLNNDLYSYFSNSNHLIIFLINIIVIITLIFLFFLS